MFVSADDMIPATLFVVNQSRLASAYSIYYYLDIFKDPNERFGQIEQQLTCFYSVLTFLSGLDG